MVGNAEEPLKKPQQFADAKFDRIICNCVLMLTENAEKMLRNLHNEAKEGCLLGVSVWGSKQSNYMLTSTAEAIK
jgi:2-polyprenyl-3-methyl-5-hydroxy-6-metoxy-1,4-benzoquinol methylase